LCDEEGDESFNDAVSLADDYLSSHKICAKCGATNYASAKTCAEGCGSDEFEGVDK
jgi:ribosomal protein L40E